MAEAADEHKTIASTLAPRRLADFTADPRTLILAVMALVIGSVGALAAWILVKLIAIVTNLVWFGRLDGHLGTLAHAHRGLWMVVAPALGGLAVGLMARYGSKAIRGHGIPEAIETILIGQSRMSPKVAVLKPLSSAIAIGTGGPFGAEGPIIMTGGALGSLFAQFFDLSAAERKTLLVSGAVAGMTAIFGTPVAAVLLAVELLLFEWKPRSFIPVSVAAVVAIAWRPLFFENAPLFAMAHSPLIPPWAFFACVALGAIVGLQSGLLTVLLYRCEELFERLPIHWMWWPAIGGIAVGLGGLIQPRVLGVGYDVIDALLHDTLTLDVVVSVLLVKSAIWLVSLSSGTSGGVLAPLLMLGGALGWVIGLALPGDHGLWALLGMAAMLGGTMRAPLTGAIFAAELTGDFNHLPALLTATVASYAVTVLLLKRSILTEKIARRGRHISQEYSVDPYELARAGEIMVTEVDTLSATLPLAQAVERFMSPDSHHLAYPVVDADGALVGVASRQDALRWQLEELPLGDTLGDRVSDSSAAAANPENVVGYVADLMIAEDKGLIPVVEPGTRRLLGVITRKDLLAVRRASGVSENERARFYARRRLAGAKRLP